MQKGNKFKYIWIDNSKQKQIELFSSMCIHKVQFSKVNLM